MKQAAIDPVLVVNFLPRPSQIKYLLRTVLGVRGSPHNKRMAFFRTILTFGIGVYAGIYAAQNYEVPKLDPSLHYKTLIEWMEQHKKDK
jgi:hypothetical protein